MSIRVTVWGENVHEQKNKVVSGIYPLTMHGTIADFLILRTEMPRSLVHCANYVRQKAIMLWMLQHGLPVASPPPPED